MEDHFECLWDLFRSIPSLEVEDASVLDEFYWLNKEDPNFSKCRVIENKGQRIPDDGQFTLSDKSSEEMVKLYMTSESELQGLKITDVFSEEFFESNFWTYWASMFAFEKWHSAIEMRRYILRFIHHIDGLPDLSALKFTKYNQYESLVLPLVNYLKKHNVQFEYDTVVKNVIVEHVGSDMKRIAEYIQKISKRDPYAGKVVTGGIVTVRDSNWMMSYTLNRQPHFKAQSKDELVVWIYGLYSGIKGNYVEKPIEECTGIEIAEEWLYHMGVPEELIHEFASEGCSTVPCYMPYITSYFMARKDGDRPLVVPNGSKNIAFIGNFAETPRDTVFTTEYSVRTAMEAVYTLLDVDRGVPEVFASAYDLRVLTKSTNRLMDGKKLADVKVPFLVKLFEKRAVKKIKGTMIEELLKDANLI